ncbi:MAG: T9SS type A sorting domain-containing protein, partial [Candidatus Cloacimonadia bacterium]
NYDMSLISPELVLPDDPDNIHNLTIRMYIDDFSPDSGEVMEIWIIHGEQETRIFEWDLDENNDWGYPGGTDWVYSGMDQFAGETIQFKFRSHGSNTYNFNYWYIYMIHIIFTSLPPYGTLVVTASDSSGNPIEGITLNAVHLQDGAYYNAYTNENGIFTVSPMRPGEYQFTFYYNYPCPPEIVTGIIIQEDFISLFDITSVSTISISPTYIDTTMAPDDSMAVYITIQNHRDVPIHWFADIENSGLNNRNDKVFRDNSDAQNEKMNLKPQVSNPSYPNDSPSYLSTKATHGIIAPGQSFDWLLFLDTIGQTPGTILEFDVVFTFDPNVGTVVVPVTVTIIEEGINDVPSISTKLDQNYPNPFSTSTTISFSLSPNYKGDPQIKIYNIKGQCIRELKIKFNEEAVWDGKDESGKAVSSGIYFYRLEVGDKVIDTKKCLILR